MKKEKRKIEHILKDVVKKTKNKKQNKNKNKKKKRTKTILQKNDNLVQILFFITENNSRIQIRLTSSDLESVKE